jgi:hypothetical protein
MLRKENIKIGLKKFDVMTGKFWSAIQEKIQAGSQLETPGRGIPPTGQAPFYVVEKGDKYLKIEIGSKRTPNILPKEMFDQVEKYFEENPREKLRIAATHTTHPLPRSVDEILRDKSSRALGNYVAAILEKAGCVEYCYGEKKQKCIKLKVTHNSVEFSSPGAEIGPDSPRCEEKGFNTSLPIKTKT